MAQKPIKEIMLRFYPGEENILAKITRISKLFNEKAENKTIKKMIKEFGIN